MMGGGMRQAGIIAAAGLYALDHGRERLSIDHDNAKAIAAGLQNISGLDIPDSGIDTNIVIIAVDPDLCTASDMQERCATLGLRFWPTGPQRFRLVTHLDVNQDDCAKAVEIVSAACRN